MHRGGGSDCQCSLWLLNRSDFHLYSGQLRGSRRPSHELRKHSSHSSHVVRSTHYTVMQFMFVPGVPDPGCKTKLNSTKPKIKLMLDEANTFSPFKYMKYKDNEQYNGYN